MSPPRSRTRNTPARSAQGRPGTARVQPGASTDELRGLLEPVVTGAGFELDALDVRSSGRRHTVRMVVDSDAGTDLDDIARLSRAASDALDHNEHLVGGSYTLEVTSPGVDRPLTAPRHWRRARLRLVTVRPRPGSALGDAVFAGRVGTAGEEAVTVLVEGRLREVRYADVAHAAVEVEFAPPPEKEIALLDPGAVEDDAVQDRFARPGAAEGPAEDSVEDSQ
jgi:ribosome maturation factor RimP